MNERGNITPSDAADNDQFGIGTALSGDGSILAVGASSWEGVSGTDRGTAYIFDWNGSSWVERGNIEPSDASDGDGLGICCALSSDGSILAVGAIGWDGAGTDRGTVYIFDWNGSSWVERGNITPSDAADGDFFGYSCALSSDGSILAVGARNWEGVSGSNRGTVYIFDWNGSSWVERGNITPSDAADGDFFGVSCALSSDGSILAVGASDWEGVSGSNRGTVYIFDWNGSSWVERGNIEPSDASDGDQFGRSCALNNIGTILAVGAYSWDGAGTDRGKAYIYEYDGSNWNELTSITPASPSNSDRFGCSCAVNAFGSIIAIGAFGWDGAGTDRGTCYIFDATQISGSITESSPISQWQIVAAALDGTKIRSVISTGASYAIPFFDDEAPCFVSLTPEIDGIWSASASIPLGYIVAASDPSSDPHLWECTTAGTTGGTEPTWNTSGTTSDNTVTWTYIGALLEWKIEGPLIPA